MGRTYRIFVARLASVAIIVCGIRALGQSGPSSTVRTAIVLDFANHAGRAGAGLDRFATDAVAVELANSGPYEVTKGSEAEREAVTGSDSIGRRTGR